jgi:hypothetical protein
MAFSERPKVQPRSNQFAAGYFTAIDGYEGFAGSTGSVM